MNKKAIALITMASVLSCGYFNTALAANIPESVEISFKVGDSTLLINKNPVTVETPYVAGEGTTLVPLRVITEAFGAEVEWDNDTETVTLEYPDVNVSLQIGNKIATVNDYTETLLEAPVLSENDVTMVPLRFISETFGADVSYDADTEAILVVKKNTETDGIITGITDLSRVGDSFYGWSINTPKSLTMTKRTFGGLLTVFEDEKSSIKIDIMYMNEDDSIDNYLEMLKDVYSSMTLVKADKNLTDSFGNKYIHFQAKNDKYFLDRRAFFINDKIINIYAITDSSVDNSVGDNFLSYVDSFSAMGFNAADTHDLSNLNADNTRTFKNDKYKITMDLPQEFVEDSNSNNPENIFRFAKFTKEKEDKNHLIGISVYSKSDMDAKTMAEEDFKSNTQYYNSDYIKTTVPEAYSFGSYEGYKYTLFKKDNSFGLTDVFFENGDYVYNISFQVPEESSEKVSKMLKSLKAEKLNSSELGTLIRNTSDETVTSTRKAGNISVKVPSTYYTAISASSLLLINSHCDASIMISDLGNDAISSSDLSEARKSIFTAAQKDKGAVLVSPMSTQYINGTLWYITEIKFKDSDGEMRYDTMYMGNVGKRTVAISLSEQESTYKVKTNEDLEAIIKSITVD